MLIGFRLPAVVVVVVLGCAVPMLGQSDPFVGTWVLDVESSTFEPPAQNPIATRTLVIAPEEDMVSHTQETFRQGQRPVAKVWFEARYDGKDYRIMGALFDSVSLTRSGNTLTRTGKNVGKPVETAVYTLSADGRTLTVKTEGENNFGVPYSSNQIFRKDAGSAQSR